VNQDITSGGTIGVGLGHEVEVSGDLAIAGALTDDAGQFSGSAFAFRRDSLGRWRQVAKLTADDAAAGDHFGNALSISGDEVLIGAWVDDHMAGTDAGSAYLFPIPIPEPATCNFALVGTFVFAVCRRRYTTKNPFPFRTQPLSIPLPR
jgi:hypothetical protein